MICPFGRHKSLLLGNVDEHNSASGLHVSFHLVRAEWAHIARR